MLTATSQRAADAFTVSPFASDAPNDSQRSLWLQARQRRTAQRVEGSAAALALVAPQTPRHTARNRPLARAVRTAPGLVHTKLDCCLRCRAFAPARQHRERLAPLRARQPARRRKPHLETPDVHDPTPCRSSHSTVNAYNSRIEPLLKTIQINTNTLIIKENLNAARSW